MKSTFPCNRIRTINRLSGVACQEQMFMKVWYVDRKNDAGKRAEKGGDGRWRQSARSNY